MEYKGKLITVDFEDNTMTFEIEGKMRLESGKYKIIQLDEKGNSVTEKLTQEEDKLNWFEKKTLHHRYIYYMIGGIISGYLLNYLF